MKIEELKVDLFLSGDDESNESNESNQTNEDIPESDWDVETDNDVFEKSENPNSGNWLEN